MDVEFTPPPQFVGRWYVSFQQSNYFGRNGVAILPGAFAESAIEIVRDVFDVQRWHRTYLAEV